jgi:hypothetical protein
LALQVDKIIVLAPENLILSHLFKNTLILRNYFKTHLKFVAKNQGDTRSYQIKKSPLAQLKAKGVISQAL